MKVCPSAQPPAFQKYRSQRATKINEIHDPWNIDSKCSLFFTLEGQGTKSATKLEPKELQFDPEMHHNLDKSPSWAYRWVPDVPQRSQVFSFGAENLTFQCFLILLSDKNVWISDGFSHFSRVGGMRRQPGKFYEMVRVNNTAEFLRLF